MIDAVFAVARRTFLASMRRPVVLTFSLAQPLLWMAFFGFLFERSVTLRGEVTVDYPSFVAPGIATMSLLFGASQSGVSIVRDVQTGMLARMLGAKTPAAALLAGKLLGDGLRLSTQALLVLLFASALGTTFVLDFAELATSVASVLVLVVELASVSCLLASIARAPEPMGAYVHLVNMPLLFTSSALLPRRNLPEWVVPLATNNPLSLVAESLRSLCLGSAPIDREALLAHALVATMLFGLAARSLARRGRRAGT